MGVYKEIAKADGSGITTFYRLSEEKSTVETTSTGTTETMFDYNDTLNKPSINNVALVGNKTLDELGIQPAGDYITEIPAEYITEEELEAKDYATEAFVMDQINNAEHFHREIVDALPLTGKDNILYLVPKKGSDKDIYNEYIWAGVDYELMGTTAVDLSDYYKKGEVDTLLDNKVTKVNGKQLSTNDYTTDEKTKLASLENYDDSELRSKVDTLHNYDDTEVKQEINQLKTAEEDIYEILDNAGESIDKKVEGIRLVKSGDSWTFYDIKGNIISFQLAKTSLGLSNTILFLEDIENDGKMIPVNYDIDEDTIHVYYTNYEGEYRYANLQSSSVDDRPLGIANHYTGIVDALPTSANKGDIVKLSTDKTIYLYDGTEWSAFDKASEVDLSNYLAKDNTVAYKPATDYNPSTKKYVDDSIADIFIPTKVSQLTNDSGFVLKTTNDLTNYYNKSNTYNKAEVNALVAGGGGGESLIEILDITNNLDATSLLTEGSHIYLLQGGGKLSFKVRKNGSQSSVNLYEDTLVFTYYDESGLSITYLGLQEYGNVIFEGTPTKSSVFDEINEKEINYIDGSAKAPGVIMKSYINITTNDLDIDVYLNGSEELTSITLPHSTLLIGKASKIINKVSKGLIIFPTGEIYTITKATVANLHLTKIYDTVEGTKDIIHHTWTTESGIATEGDDLALGQAILDRLMTGKNILLDIHTNDTPDYIANCYHTNFDGLYSYDTSQSADGHYSSITYRSAEKTNVYSGSTDNSANVSSRYTTLQITVANDIVTKVQLIYYHNQVSLLPTNNVKSYEPTSDYHPATKKYVDDSIALPREDIDKLVNGERPMGKITVENVVGRNLLNKYNPQIIHAYPDGSTKEWIFDDYGYSFVVEVESNKDYTISKSNGVNIFNISSSASIPASGGSATNLVDGTSTEIHIRTGENDKYLIGYFAWSQTSIDVKQLLDTVQVEEGPTATPYTPYLNIQELQENRIINFKDALISGTSDANGFIETSIPMNANILSCKLTSQDGMCLPYVHTNGNFSFKCTDWNLNSFATQSLTIYVIYMDN